MKIGFAGSHGTGKSTLAEWVAREYQITLIPDLAREMRVSGRCPDQVKKVSDRAWIMFEQIRLERELNKSFVADGSLYAPVVYLTVSPYVDYVEDFEAVVSKYANYDMLFYVPIEFEPRPDYMRSSDIAYQNEVDEIYRHYLDDNKIEYVEVTGEFEKRQKIIGKAIDVYEKRRGEV